MRRRILSVAIILAMVLTSFTFAGSVAFAEDEPTEQPIAVTEVNTDSPYPVFDKEVAELTLLSEPAVKTFELGAPLDFTGCQVLVKFIDEDELTVDITPEMTTGWDINTAGVQTVTYAVSEELFVTFDIEITEPVVTPTEPVVVPAKFLETRNLTVVSRTKNSIKFRWDKAPKAKKYQVYYKKAGAKKYKKKYVKGNSVTLKKLKLGSKCSVKVRAIRGKKKGPFTPVLTTSTLTKAERNELARKAACNWAIKIANDNSFHYGEKSWAHHMGCYFCGTNQSATSTKVKAGATPADAAKTYVCCTFVSAAYNHGAGAPGVTCKAGNFIGNGKGYANKPLQDTTEFKYLGCPDYSKLIPGDIVLTDTHTLLYVGNGKSAEAYYEDDGVRNSTKWNNSIIYHDYPKSRYDRCTTIKVYRYIGTGKY